MTLGRRRRLPYGAAALAAVRAWRVSHRLPPGAMTRLDEAERTDRLALMHLSRTHGPIFRGVMDERLAICVVGNAIGRRLLRDHAAALRPVTIDVSALFPGRFMRAMEGETHRTRRAALVRGLGALDYDACAPSLRAIAHGALNAYADGPVGGPDAFQRWSAALSQIASGLLIRVVLGQVPGDPAFARLMNGYRALGPHGVAWRVGAPQIAAYAGLRAQLQGDPGAGDPPGLLGLMTAQGAVDDTMLGNLIYMVEMGRYDLRGLLRWIFAYAAAQPLLLRRIAEATPARAAIFADAFVREVLRLDQSERLMRDVLEDITFDGFFIPRGALLRVCMWEAHKDEDSFARPFAFDPERFLDGRAFGERFSPFGLDHHLCPFAGISVRLAAMTLITVARDFTITAQGGAPAVRGPYHWEPAPDLSVTLTKRDAR
ncbi:MAG: cytochrome P450 [Paracoccaceae bacterium]|jgi:cytochrome P450